jgi:hypothetical protein
MRFTGFLAGFWNRAETGNYRPINSQPEASSTEPNRALTDVDAFSSPHGLEAGSPCLPIITNIVATRKYSHDWQTGCLTSVLPAKPATIQNNELAYPVMLAFAPHSVCSVRNPVAPGLKMNVMTSSAGAPTM